MHARNLKQPMLTEEDIRKLTRNNRIGTDGVTTGKKA